jgi:hypothetical protein
LFLALEIIIKTICWINGIISQVAVGDASLNTNSGKNEVISLELFDVRGSSFDVRLILAIYNSLNSHAGGIFLAFN